ncbi:MAG: phosphatidate cytidylyltransferase [Actinomycetota bacterium]|nr:phosphatidate cytidylyltransferase [Actinomycetota bacterium]
MREGPAGEPVVPAAAPGRSLRQAIVTGAALVLVVGLSAAFGAAAYFVLITLAIALAVFEAIDALQQQGRRPSLAFALACSLALLVAAYTSRPALFGVVLAFALYGGFALSLRPSRGPSPVSDVAWTLLVVGWIGGGGAAATSLLVAPSGRSLLTAFILVAAADDIGAFFVGRKWGVHKLAPRVSPGKTWEGFAGGLVATVAAGALAGTVVEPLGLVGGVVLGLLCGLIAPAGDLMESLFKREMGIKDSGRLLPGHGGVLDRLDALIFCAPAAYLYAIFFIA